MRYYHRHSFFPLVIILLTLLLAAFMLLTVSRESVAPTVMQEIITPVNADAYRTLFVHVITTFETDIASASDDSTKLVVTERAFADLIALRVPLSDKQLHLSLALVLTNIQAALKSDDRTIDSLLLEIQTIKESL